MAKKKKQDIDVESFLTQEGRVQPQAVDVEKNILCAMLLDKEAVSISLEILEPRDFYKDSHKLIYEAIISLYQRNEPVDLITLEEELRKQGHLEAIGGAYYLAELANLLPSSANVETHIKIVKDKAMLRHLIKACTLILKEAYDETEEVENILGDAQQQIFDILKTQKQKSYEAIKPILNETFSELERLHHTQHTGVIGVPSGFASLDDITAGFQKADLIILAGRPSMGKTALALNIARNAAINSNIPVGFFSMEMSDQQLVQRLLCAEAMVDSQKLRTGKLRDKEWPKISGAAGVLAEAPIYIDDTPALDYVKLSARARRMALERNIGLIIIDYLQLMEAPSRRFDNRQQEIAYISRSLKGLAKQLNLPIIALSQLSRAVENRPDKRPNLADLRESGAIEQDADLVMFVYREEVYLNKEKDKDNEKLEKLRNVAEIIIGKHRNGPIGAVKLTFLKNYGKFSDKPPKDRYSVDEELAPTF